MARSRLYRSRFLQENIRSKALDEIYKIHMLLHRSDLNFRRLALCCIDDKFCKKIFVGKLLTRSARFTCICTAQTSIFQKFFVNFFSHFLAKKMQKFVIFEFFSLIFAQILMKFCRNFADNLEIVEIKLKNKFQHFLNYPGNPEKNLKSIPKRND